jgi:hypothetical protein
MDLGDIVIYGGQRFYVRGLDPLGVHPRQLYLENVRTGEKLSVAFEHQGATAKGPRVLRMLRGDAGDSSGRGDPGRGEAEQAEEDSPR